MSERRSEKWFDDRVEAYVDNDLPRGEARLFEARLNTDGRLKAAVSEARSITAALRDLPHYRCPSDLSQRVSRITGASADPRRHWMWAAAAAAFGALAVTVALRLQPIDKPSETELAHARQDLALALAYLDKAGTTAVEEVGEQWINNGWVRPVQRGLGKADKDAS